MVSGEHFADALSGSVAAAKSKSPIILTDGNVSLKQTSLESNIPSINQVNILGGEAVVSKVAAQNLLSDKTEQKFKLGDELLISKYSNLIKNKNVGLVTNQTGVDSRGVSTIDLLTNYGDTKASSALWS